MVKGNRFVFKRTFKGANKVIVKNFISYTLQATIYVPDSHCRLMSKEHALVIGQFSDWIKL